MNAFNYAVFILFLSWLVQTVTEVLFGKPFERAGDQYAWLLSYLAIAVGIALAAATGLDLLYIAVVELSPEPVTWMTWQHVIGLICSGVLLGGGSGFVNDFVKWMMGKKLNVMGK